MLVLMILCYSLSAHVHMFARGLCLNPPSINIHYRPHTEYGGRQRFHGCLSVHRGFGCLDQRGCLVRKVGVWSEGVSGQRGRVSPTRIWLLPRSVRIQLECVLVSLNVHLCSSSRSI